MSEIQQFRALFFHLFFTGIETFGAFRLLALLHALTQGFVLLRMDRSIIFL